MKEKTAKRLNIVIFAVLTLAMCAIIFYMSSMDANKSSELFSGWFGNFLKRIVAGLPELMGEGVDADLRKYGHIFEFLLLGVVSTFLSWECWHPLKKKYIGAMDPKSSRSVFGSREEQELEKGRPEGAFVVRGILAWATALVFCFLYACSDEWHQTFVPGRRGSILDVLRFDLPGLAIGTIIVLIINILLGLRENKQKKFVDLT